MKRLIGLSLLSILAAVAPQAVASDLKIAFVDTERILRESAPAIQAGKRLEREFEPRKKELDKLSEQIRTLQQRLDSNKLAEAARRHTDRELVRLKQDLQRKQIEFDEDMITRRNEELSNLNTVVMQAIQRLAATEQIDLILQEAVYHTPRIDITDKTLQYLQRK